MADVTVKRLEDFDTAFDGAMRLVRHGLGVESFGIQVFDMPPNADRYPEHDHSHDGQEEVYTVLEGVATLTPAGEEHELRPGMFARVGPGEKRKSSTGAGGRAGAGARRRPRQGLRGAGLHQARSRRPGRLNLGIEGKVALVMGASKGLGRATAAALAREGARVAMSSRSAERIEAAAAEVAPRPAPTCAASRPTPRPSTSCPRWSSACARTLGPVDILVTNTGGPPLGDPLSSSASSGRRAYRSLVLAPMALIEAVVPEMRERGWGRIVNITSIATKEPIPG